MTKKSSSSYPLKYQFLQRIAPMVDRLAPAIAGRLAKTAFFKPIQFPTPAQEIALRNKAREVVYEVKGKKIFAYVWNDTGNETMLLMHGWASRATHFTAIINQAILKGYRVVGLDAPAHGKSDGKFSDVAQFAQAILDLEQREGQFHAAVGHSMGGTAILYAMNRGLKIPHVTLMATPAIEEEIIEAYVSKMFIKERSVAYMLKYIEEQFGHPFEKHTALYIAQSISFKYLHLVFDQTDRQVSTRNADALLETVSSATKSIITSQGHSKMLADNAVADLVLSHIGSGLEKYKQETAI